MGQAKQKKARGTTGQKVAYRAQVHVYGMMIADRASGQKPQIIGIEHPSINFDDQIAKALNGSVDSFSGVLDGYPDLTVYFLRENADLARNSDATGALVGRFMQEGHSMKEIAKMATWVLGPAVFRWTEVWPSVEVPLPAAFMHALLPTISRHGSAISYLVKESGPNRCRVYTPDEEAPAIQCLLTALLNQAQTRNAANSN
jgi:hypothetical protein